VARGVSAAVALEQARTRATIEPKILLVIASSFVLFRSFSRKRESRVAWVPAFAGTSGIPQPGRPLVRADAGGLDRRAPLRDLALAERLSNLAGPPRRRPRREPPA